MPFDIAALVEQYAQAEVAAVVEPLQDTIASLNATISSDTAELAAAAAKAEQDAETIADLQAQLAALQPKASVLYGANAGGWFSTVSPAEGQAAATARIKAGFGGQLPAIRVWTANGVPTAGYMDATCQRYVCELAAGMSDVQLDAAFKATPKNAVLVPAHEPETKLTPADFQAFATRVGAAHVRSGRTDVRVALMLMGNTYDPKRYSVNHGGPNTVGYFWDQWIPVTLPPGVDAIGGDLYPWGTEAKADTAAYIIQPAIDAATKMGVPFHVGEFGCGSVKWSDPVRAKYTAAAFDLFDAHAEMFPTVCVYEADNGSQGPWCVLPKMDGTGGFPLTAAVVAKRMAAVPKA